MTIPIPRDHHLASVHHTVSCLLCRTFFQELHCSRMHTSMHLKPIAIAIGKCNSLMEWPKFSFQKIIFNVVMNQFFFKHSSRVRLCQGTPAVQRAVHSLQKGVQVSIGELLGGLSDYIDVCRHHTLTPCGGYRRAFPFAKSLKSPCWCYLNAITATLQKSPNGYV